MAYRSNTTGYLIRDIPKRNHSSSGNDQDEDEESERIDVDDDDRQFVSGSHEIKREEIMGGGVQEYKKKYTFTQRKPATFYHCEECDKTFKHPSKIAEHLRKHTREKPFLCNVCGSRFSQGGSLKVHMRAHLGEMPYKCSYCDRHFSTPYNQRIHEAVHIRGGRLCRDIRYRPREDERVKMHSASHPSQKRRGVGQERGNELYECGVPNCGFQHSNRHTVEEHVQNGHTDMWDGQEMEGVEGEEIIDVDDGGDYQNYTYYEYVEHDTLMDDHEMVVMTEEEVAAANASNGEVEEEAEERDDGDERDHLPSSTTPLSPQLSLHPSMGIITNTHLSSASNGGNSLVIEADEHIDDERMRKEMTEDGRTKRLRLLTLGRTGMMEGIPKEELYGGEGETYSSDAPRASYEVEVMTSGEGAGESATEVSSTMEEEEDEQDAPPVFSELTRAQLMQEDMEAVDDIGRMKVMGDYRQSAKGRRIPFTKWHLEMECDEEAELERAMLEQVLPQPLRNPVAINRRNRKKHGSTSRNLDWIIDAVAEGRDVDQASPHNRKKPMIHTCQFCGKVDKYPSKIEAHMRTHTGEKPFTCDFCGLGFAQKTPLRMHMRRHLNERSFVCEVDGCSARFISQSLLNAHMSSRHLNTKRFVCMKGCGRWFANGRNQRQHEAKCNHIINRTTVNADYLIERREYEESTDGNEVDYLEEDEDVDVDDEEYDETLLEEHGEHADMETVQPAYL